MTRMHLGPVYDFLIALRLAGCRVWIDDEGDLLCSPPLQRVDWPGDVEEAFDERYWELKALVSREHVTVH
jgi:hypothetical protein